MRVSLRKQAKIVPHNCRFFWKGLCFILFQLYGPKVGFFEGNFFWGEGVSTIPPTFILEEELREY